MPSKRINNLQRKQKPQLVKKTLLTNSRKARKQKAAATKKQKRKASSRPKAEPKLPPPPPKPKRKKRAIPRIPQEEEVSRFFKALDKPIGPDAHRTRDRAMFRLMYHAGLRASEVGLLTMRDYSPRTERIMVTRLKGSNSGYHHLLREEARVLHAWLKIRGNKPGAIFMSRNSNPISRQMLDVLMRQYAHRAGWPPKLCHCHSFKHACCTHLLNKGFNIEQVQDWVGHANIQNTMVYAKITNARRAEMARMLADWK